MPEKSTDIIAFDLDPLIPSKDTVERNRANGFLELEDQKKAFAIKYVSNGYKYREAAKAVGYPVGKSRDLIYEPLVAAYIADLQQKYLAESIVTKSTLDSYLDRLEDIAFGETEIDIVTGSGEEKKVNKFHPELAMKVYNERAKLHGLSKEDSGGKGGVVNVTINTAGLIGESGITIEGNVVE